MIVQESLELWVSLIVTTGVIIWGSVIFPGYLPAPFFWICVLLCAGSTIYVIAKIAILIADALKDLRRRPGQSRKIEWYTDNTVLRFFKGMADLFGSRKIKIAPPQTPQEVIVCMQKLNEKLEPNKPR